MKRNLVMLSFGVLMLVSSQSFASIFSRPSQHNPLQMVFSQLGYSHINVSNYQVNLNLTFEGYIDVQLLSKSGAFGNQVGFGVFSFEKYSEEPAKFKPKFQELFDPFDTPSSTVKHIGFQRPTNLGFYLYSGNGNQSENVYSLSGMNRFNSVQARFYRDPLQKSTYLLAWEELNTRNPLSNGGYDDAVLKITLHPTPEPATWALFALGLIGISLFVLIRRRSKMLG
jgi:hypothetical protein